MYFTYRNDDEVINLIHYYLQLCNLFVKFQVKASKYNYRKMFLKKITWKLVNSLWFLIIIKKSTTQIYIYYACTHISTTIYYIFLSTLTLSANNNKLIMKYVYTHNKYTFFFGRVFNYNKKIKGLENWVNYRDTQIR